MKDIIAADQADIAGLFGDEATLTKQLNTAKADMTANGQMVAGYLQGKLEELHGEEDDLNQDLQNALAALGNAQNQLLQDQIQDDSLKSAYIGLQNQWTSIHLTTPCPY